MAPYEGPPNSNLVAPKALDIQGLLITGEQGMKVQDGEKDWGRIWSENLADIHLTSFLHFGGCQEGLGFQTIQVDRQQVKVFIVEQTVHSTAGIPMSCQFFLLSDG